MCCALFYILIPTKKTHGVEVFCSRPNPYSSIPVEGKDNLQIDFKALTMINPASSRIEIVELPVVK